MKTLEKWFIFTITFALCIIGITVLNALVSAICSSVGFLWSNSLALSIFRYTFATMVVAEVIATIISICNYFKEKK